MHPFGDILPSCSWLPYWACVVALPIKYLFWVPFLFLCCDPLVIFFYF